MPNRTIAENWWARYILSRASGRQPTDRKLRAALNYHQHVLHRDTQKSTYGPSVNQTVSPEIRRSSQQEAQATLSEAELDALVRDHNHGPDHYFD